MIIDTNKLSSLVNISAISAPVENSRTDTLPTPSEPGSPQFSYTVSASNFVTFSRDSFIENNDINVNLSGDNTTGGNATVYYNVYYNAGSIKTGSNSMSTNRRWSMNVTVGDVSVGDTIEVAVWSDVANVDFLYDMRVFSYSSPFYEPAETVITVEEWSISPNITLTGRAGYSQFIGGSVPNATAAPDLDDAVGSTSNGGIVYGYSHHPTLGFYKGLRASANTASIENSSTFLPLVRMDSVISNIKYRVNK